MNKEFKESCVLLINDIHVSKDNISEFNKNWDEALSVCKNRNIDTIVIGGDLWQSRAGQTLNVLMAARGALLKANSMGINVIIEPGNHDKVDPDSILSYNHIFSEYPNVDVVDDFAQYSIGNKVVLWLIAYFPENGSFENMLNRVIEMLDSQKTNILYCHEGINGGLSAISDKEISPDKFKAFDKVLVGHYHNRASISNGLIEYIGASRQHNFGEDEDKGYTILYSDGSTEFVPNTVNTKYTTIELTSENLGEAKKLLEQVTDGQTKVRLKISCSNDQAATIDKSALIEMGASKVEVLAEITESKVKAEDLNKKFDKSGLKSEYTHFCAQKEIDNVEMGLHYLDKIDELCGD